MLKWALWLLVLGNAGYFAWSQGYLETLGLAPAEQREPQRLAQQVRPEALRLLNGPRAESAQAVAAPAPATVPAAAAAPAPATAATPQPAPTAVETAAPAPAPAHG